MSAVRISVIPREGVERPITGERELEELAKCDPERGS
jgi:hypothetical protein